MCLQCVANAICKLVAKQMVACLICKECACECDFVHYICVICCCYVIPNTKGPVGCVYTLLNCYISLGLQVGIVFQQQLGTVDMAVTHSIMQRRRAILCRERYRETNKHILKHKHLHILISEKKTKSIIRSKVQPCCGKRQRD